MRCLEAYHYLLEDLDEHLDEPSRKAIRRHFQHCTDCTSMVRSLKKMIDLYRAVPDLEVRSSVTARVLGAVARARRASLKSPRKKAR